MNFIQEYVSITLFILSTIFLFIVGIIYIEHYVN